MNSSWQHDGPAQHKRSHNKFKYEIYDTRNMSIHWPDHALLTDGIDTCSIVVFFCFLYAL